MSYAANHANSSIEDMGTLRARDLAYPAELRQPDGFRPEDPATWPSLDGRLEYVGGRLLYMPPCGDLQSTTVVDLSVVLGRWTAAHREFVAGSNEAGMLLDDDVRGADAAIWRRDAAGSFTGGFRRVPPILAVEVAGRDEGEDQLREKAAWYFAHGVKRVWIVLPRSREVVVLDHAGHDQRVSGADRLPESPELPGLAPIASELFASLD